MEINSSEYRHLLSKVSDVKRGGRDAWSVQSTGEKLAVAFALNRPDWIASMDYTLIEAVDRIGPEWMSLMKSIFSELDSYE